MIPKLSIVRTHGLSQAHLKKAPFVNSSQPKLKDIVSGSSRAPNVESS